MFPQSRDYKIFLIGDLGEQQAQLQTLLQTYQSGTGRNQTLEGCNLKVSIKQKDPVSLTFLASDNPSLGMINSMLADDAHYLVIAYKDFDKDVIAALHQQVSGVLNKNCKVLLLGLKQSETFKETNESDPRNVVPEAYARDNGWVHRIVEINNPTSVNTVMNEVIQAVAGRYLTEAVGESTVKKQTF